VTVNANIHEAKTQLSRLLEQVANGERVIISKAGRPVAELVPHQRTQVVLGGLRGQLTYDDESSAVGAGRQPAARPTRSGSDHSSAGRPRLGGERLEADDQGDAGQSCHFRTASLDDSPSRDWSC
jgi:prevent-host-death family protein